MKNAPHSPFTSANEWDVLASNRVLIHENGGLELATSYLGSTSDKKPQATLSDLNRRGVRLKLLLLSLAQGEITR